MKYKHILKEYKKYQAERTKRYELLLKALSDRPEPTEEQEREAYRRVAKRSRRMIDEARPVFNMECLIDYLQDTIDKEVPND